MKTGRVRKKATPPPKEPAAPAPTQSAAPAPTPTRPAPARPAGRRANQVPTGVWIVGGLFLIMVCFIMIMTVFGRKKAEEWVEVTRATGEWTTTVTVFGPQVNVEERWEADCLNEPNGVIRTGTCILKDTNTYHDTEVDNYDEYAYNIYYEETYAQVYEARGAEFAVTQLKTDDWWQENLHYVLTEELDQESCEYTNYTLWVDDPQDSTQEVEVYLSECEVWDHVIVYERVYEQKAWCQCDVTTLVQVGQETDSGSGANVMWVDPSVPAGGRTERAFQGRVTFLGDDYTYTTTTQDLAQYQDYLAGPYYLGIRDDQAVSLRKNPPK
jgi:hypothetical protein